MQYFLIISSSGIGGAETRALKILYFLSNIKKISCHIVLNKSLLMAYKNNRFTNFLIENSNFKIHVFDRWNKLFFITDDFLNLVIRDKRIYKFLKYVPNIFLKYFSCYNFLRKIIEDKTDVRLHCMHGETARIGTLFVAKENSTLTNFEITSNRHVNEWALQFSKILSPDVQYKNIKITCVSETVKQNFSKALLNFNNRFLNPDYYSAPFLYFPKLYESYNKEKIIVFGHRLIPPKNPVLLAKVVKEMYDDKTLYGWKVYFRGVGKLDVEVKSILSEQIKSNNVEVSYTNDLQNDLKKSMIFVSLVVTGNFPSNSIFEAMNYGNLLVLSNTGITKEKFSFSEVFLCDLNQKSLRQKLLDAIVICNNNKFKRYSDASELYYKKIVAEEVYIKKLFSKLKINV